MADFTFMVENFSFSTTNFGGYFFSLHCVHASSRKCGQVETFGVHVDDIGRIVNVDEYKTFVHDDDDDDDDIGRNGKGNLVVEDKPNSDNFCFCPRI